MQNQKITIELIETKEFHVAARGYNQHEVDEFLDSICDELERIEAEMTALKTENNRLKNQALPQRDASYSAYQAPKASSSSAQEVLEMAQRIKEEMVADAQAKAAEIISNAEVEAKARLGNLGAEKEELEASLNTLKKAVQTYKANFASLIASAQDALNAADEL